MSMSFDQRYGGAGRHRAAGRLAGSGDCVDWVTAQGLVAYDVAVAQMDSRAFEIRAGRARECVWLLEHPPIYTAGTSADPVDLLMPQRFPVHVSGRGGQYTYHGPGQRTAYVMLDLERRGRGVRAYVSMLEAWLIATLGALGVEAGVRKGRVGVWVARDNKPTTEVSGPVATTDDKIAAIGVRIRKWVTMHGVSLNVSPDLDHFSGIVPCGISEHGVTSLDALGCHAGMTCVDRVLRETFEEVFSAATGVPEGVADIAPDALLAERS